MKNSLFGKRATIWSRILVIALFYFSIGNIVNILGLVSDTVFLGIIAGAIILSFLVILSVFYDSRLMEDKTDWNPSLLYYVAAFPGLLGMAVITIYVIKREIKYGN